MAVYVDTMFAAYRGMRMCHMMADSTDELLAMVDRIGVERRWIQYPNTPREHFDIASSKRALAIAAGAKVVRSRDLVMLIRKRSGKPYDPASPTCLPK